MSNESLSSGWDELKETETNCRNVLTTAAIVPALSRLLRERKVEKVEKDTLDAMKRLSSNLEKIVTKLNNINGKIGERKGDVVPDDYFLYVEIATNLQEWFEDYNTNIMPDVIYLSSVYDAEANKDV